jgi:hypothetical protein
MFAMLFKGVAKKHILNISTATMMVSDATLEHHTCK